MEAQVCIHRVAHTSVFITSLESLLCFPCKTLTLEATHLKSLTIDGNQLCNSERRTVSAAPPSSQNVRIVASGWPPHPIRSIVIKAVRVTSGISVRRDLTVVHYA